MKFIIQILLLFIINESLTAQNYNIPFREGNQWGFANSNGEMIITPKYDSVSIDSFNNRWDVYKNDKCGIIDEKGNELLTADYDSIYFIPVKYKYNEFKVFNEGLVGYTNMHGEFILPIEYSSISKADDESRNMLELKFFVTKKGNNTFQLIDETETLLLDEIERFSHLDKGFYRISRNNKMGIFNIITKSWKINPQFDSIARFNFGHYKPLEKYSHFQYYGVKNNKIVLIDAIYNLLETNFTNLKDLFLIPKKDDDYSMETTLGSTLEREIVSVTNENSDSFQAFDVIYDRYTNLRIFITKESDKFFIKTNGVAYNKDNKYLFDEIKLFKSTYEETFDSRYALVKIKDNWQLFSIIENEFITKNGLDSYEFFSKHEDILLLTKNKKVGIFKFGRIDNNENFFFIEPSFDSFEGIDSVKDTIKEYPYFNLYKFKKNGKICIVGENNVLFFKD